MTDLRALMGGCNYPVTFPVVTHSPPYRGECNWRRGRS